jgi:chemotaxis protein methyltransferase CheR
MTRTTESEAAVDRVSALLATRIGLRPENTLRARLHRCVRDEVKARGGDLDAYLRALETNDELLQSLVNKVTVQESGFFRHPDHFVVLAEHILPTLDRPARIWSAGCANGQETYSLAMLLEERAGPGSVLATDLSTAALARTGKARYTEREITGVSPLRRARHLRHEGHHWQVNDAVRARVTTMRHNLITGLPAGIGECQVVFCRNVLIYFSAEHITAFLDRLAGVMAPGAHLFLGSAETLWPLSDRFQAVRLGNSFVYQRRDRGSGSAARAVAPAASITHVARRSLEGHDRLIAARTVGAQRRSSAPDHSAVAEPSAAARARLTATAGQAALATGDHTKAVVAFRQWLYLAPDDPQAALHLGLALDAGGHSAAAQRAFGVARAVTLQVGPERAEASLEGFTAAELLRLLDTLQGPRR